MKDFVNYTGRTDEILKTQNIVEEIKKYDYEETPKGFFDSLDSKTIKQLLIFVAAAVIIKKLLMYLYSHYMAPEPKAETKKNK